MEYDEQDKKGEATMERKLHYCEKCSRFVKIEIQKRSETLKVKGMDITLDVDTCVCQTCGATVFSPDVDDDSLKQFYREYRKRAGLLQPEEIRAIRGEYGMSQETFAKVLGMGAKTIARYENGSLQDEAQNNLILLMQDRRNMRHLLELHPDRLSDDERMRYMGNLDYNTRVAPVSDSNGKIIDFGQFKNLKERGNGYADDIYGANHDVYQI